jgi:hypothetical protein
VQGRLPRLLRPCHRLRQLQAGAMHQLHRLQATGRELSTARLAHASSANNEAPVYSVFLGVITLIPVSFFYYFLLLLLYPWPTHVSDLPQTPDRVVISMLGYCNYRWVRNTCECKVRLYRNMYGY